MKTYYGIFFSTEDEDGSTCVAITENEAEAREYIDKKNKEEYARRDLEYNDEYTFFYIQLPALKDKLKSK